MISRRTLTSAWIETMLCEDILTEEDCRTLTSAWIETEPGMAGITSRIVALSRVRGLKRLTPAPLTGTAVVALSRVRGLKPLG